MYVDDILIIYNAQKTNIKHTLNELNSIRPKIKFKIENEKQNTIDYLDITIKRLYNKLEFAIYRKLTTTDFIVPNISCHPYELKKSAIYYLINRMKTYPLSYENKTQEWNIIQTILKNNGYQPIQNACLSSIHQPNQNTNNNTNQLLPIQEKTKWATFTFFAQNQEP
jgi:hypothetical protein